MTNLKCMFYGEVEGCVVPRKKVKPISATTKNSYSIQRAEGFSQRFNVDLGGHSHKGFRNRCLLAMEKYIGHDKGAIDRVHNEVCIALGAKFFERKSYHYTFQDSHFYGMLSKFEITNDRTLFVLLQIVEIVANVDIYQDNLIYRDSDFAFEIAEALVLSGINAVLCDTPTGYAFYPANAELLDIKLVVDVLNWLNDYPKAKEKYDSALRLFLKGDRTRHVLDDCRLCLELFVKQYLSNVKSLENQISELGKFLKEKGVSAELRNMFTSLINGYTSFNNNNVKHDDKINESEIEFVIYTTGAFLRLLISATRT